ncbi:IS66 family insertion sequence element accessory protein TnpA [Bryobacter aggregatus]|uniref:IS66 family insertion sequence element accessory protein TnpA n=1 Tax=Bryobacter aggregatus TaxID=360054 RepID=UPI0004E1418D|nr:hypothetical protein [Bryobacter aggregatus]
MKSGQVGYAGLGVARKYRDSGQSRAEFCREQEIPLTTLDYYLRRDRAKPKQELVAVEVVSEDKAAASDFVLVLATGRRLEIAANFDEAGLERLLTLLERC